VTRILIRKEYFGQLGIDKASGGQKGGIVWVIRKVGGDRAGKNWEWLI